MPSDSEPRRSRIPIRGTAALFVALAIIAILLISFPAYRWFFAISVGIGLGVAAILFLWYKLRPIREEEVNNKKPLGLG
jgi:hypothetical protein